MLFAQSDGSSFFFMMLMLGVCLYGTSRFVKKVSGNATARTVVSKGASHLIRNLFK